MQSRQAPTHLCRVPRNHRHSGVEAQGVQHEGISTALCSGGDLVTRAHQYEHGGRRAPRDGHGERGVSISVRVEVLRDIGIAGQHRPGHLLVDHGGWVLPRAPSGNVIVKGDVTVAKGAALGANYPALAKGAPEGDANWLVKGNVDVDKGGTLLLGCEPAVGCVNTTFDAVKGNVIANGALGVILHSSIIGGNVSYKGGGGGVNCTPGFGPFSFGVYSDAEDDVIDGNLTVTGLRSCWFGEFRNIIMSNDTVTGNRFADPDATEVANNEVFGNLACFNNVPVAQFGDAVQPPNVVFGAIRGECKPLSIH